MSPMMIVTDNELDNELKDSGIIKDIERPGRDKGDNNVPDSLRKIIGETSKINGPQEAVELANQFGISRSSVSAYANGSTSTASYNRQPNLDYINKVKERISRKARRVLVKSIENITEEKLADAKPEVLANVARSMSAVVKEMEPELPKSDGNEKGPTFVFYSPRINEESHYDVITARE